MGRMLATAARPAPRAGWGVCQAAGMEDEVPTESADDADRHDDANRHADDHDEAGVDPSAGGPVAPLDRARKHRREWQLVIVVCLVLVAALGAWRWYQDRDHPPRTSVGAFIHPTPAP